LITVLCEGYSNVSAGASSCGIVPIRALFQHAACKIAASSSKTWHGEKLVSRC
jgi:hypothetical protein